ncbi:hypothetical protein [Candidatus Accumulibacter phosphatis]|uniref:Uncharacterized protein n=1 Tax=Candidatus Accumulibacter phosphatis TaxID=327160 RepID=A0A5S4EGV0_9PROT|nr:hypothetical protein [Candidatus Accumulibacter phosphatis]TMQ74506.1 hypothetical protein ACCUM_0118 [Candidatus Accumulibacter phosphatis]
MLQIDTGIAVLRSQERQVKAGADATWEHTHWCLWQACLCALCGW